MQKLGNSTPPLQPTRGRAALVSTSVFQDERPIVLPTSGIATVGRGLSSTVVLGHRSVSGTHAHITCTGTDYVIEDRGSANGTYVNGQYLVDRRALVFGDLVRFGCNLPLRFVDLDRDSDAAVLLAMHEAHAMAASYGAQQGAR